MCKKHVLYVRELGRVKTFLTESRQLLIHKRYLFPFRTKINETEKNSRYCYLGRRIGANYYRFVPRPIIAIRLV